MTLYLEIRASWPVIGPLVFNNSLPPGFLSTISFPGGLVILTYLLICNLFLLYPVRRGIKSEIRGTIFMWFTIVTLLLSALIFLLWILGLVSPGKTIVIANIVSALSQFLFIGYFKRQTRTLSRKISTNERITSIIAHDIRSPLAQLKMAIDLLREEQSNNQPELLTRANETVNSMLQILNHLLEYASLNATGFIAVPRPKLFSLLPFFEEHCALYESLAEAKMIFLTKNCAPSVMIFADPAFLSVVVRNLLDNAVKFSASESIVEIGCNRSGDRHHRIYVRNMPRLPMPQSKIDEVLYTENSLKIGRRDEGTGIGLGTHLCKEYLKIMGSSLKIDNEPDGAILFYFLIPFPPSKQGQLHVENRRFI